MTVLPDAMKALQALGETVTSSLEVTLVKPGSPADGALEVRDLIRKVNGVALSDDIGKASDELRAAIGSTAPGHEGGIHGLKANPFAGADDQKSRHAR